MTSRRVGRRDLLASSAVGAASALAGCGRIVDSFFAADDLSVEPPPFGPLDTDWQQFGYDASNARHTPDGSGPPGEPSVEWTVKTRAQDPPRLAVHGDLLVVTGDEELYAFDLAAGDRAWTARIDPSGDRQDWPGETQPAVDDRHVYAADSKTDLTAFDRATGEREWTVSVSGWVDPPTVHDGTVYLSDRAGTLVAVDAATGDERWRRSFGSSTPAAADGSRLLVVVDDGLASLDPSDGATRWTAAVDDAPSAAGAAPVLRDRTAYVGGPRLRAFDARSRDDERTETRQQWLWPPESSDLSVNAWVIGRDLAHVVSDGRLHAVALDAGAERWRIETDEYRNDSPVLANGSLFATTSGRAEFTLSRWPVVDGPDGSGTSFSVDGIGGRCYVAGEWAFVAGAGEIYGITGE